jgi:hypothetical protein
VTTSRGDLDTLSSEPVCGQLEVSLDVPNLGQAVGFYSRLFDVSPLAAERRAVWFDVPESVLRIELREAPAPTATRLRLCTDPRRVHVVAARLSQGGVAVAQAGLAREGSPRAISFRDPGRNSWELYSSIIGTAPPMPTRRSAGGPWRSLTERMGAAMRTASAVEVRFDRERNQIISLTRHRSRAPQWR